jgi:peptide deformylase
MLKIITHPHPTLRQKAKAVPVDEIKNLQGFIRDMEKTMISRDGLGLAANQVNVAKQIIVINTKDGILALINPKLSRKSFRKVEAEEGCLSIPGVFGIVKRHFSVRVNAITKQGKPIGIKAQGMFARVLQHEVDHINGILFTDHTKKITKGTVPHEPKKG